MNQMIDPMTGLPLQVIQPAPAMRAVNPFSSQEAPPMATTGVPQVSIAPPVQQQSALAPSSFLDKVIHTVFGTPDSKLSPEEQGEKSKKRKEAGAMATSAAENPGEGHMGIPSAGGGSLGESLGKIIGLFAKAGGG